MDTHDGVPSHPDSEETAPAPRPRWWQRGRKPLPVLKGATGRPLIPTPDDLKWSKKKGWNDFRSIGDAGDKALVDENPWRFAYCLHCLCELESDGTYFPWLTMWLTTTLEQRKTRYCRMILNKAAEMGRTPAEMLGPHMLNAIRHDRIDDYCYLKEIGWNPPDILRDAWNSCPRTAATAAVVFRAQKILHEIVATESPDIEPLVALAREKVPKYNLPPILEILDPAACKQEESTQRAWRKTGTFLISREELLDPPIQGKARITTIDFEMDRLTVSFRNAAGDMALHESLSLQEAEGTPLVEAAREAFAEQGGVLPQKSKSVPHHTF